MSALRKLLSELPGAIETVRGFGYRFAAEIVVEEFEPSRGIDSDRPVGADAADRSSAQSESGPTTPTAPAGEPEPERSNHAAEPVAASSPPPSPAEVRSTGRPPRRRRLAQRWVPLAAMLALAAIGALFVASRQPRPTAAIRAQAPLGRLAVLPFAALTGNRDDEWVGNALRELLANELGSASRVAPVPGETIARAVADLELPRSASLASETLDTLGERVGADLFLSGSYLVIGSGRDLRVDFRLERSDLDAPLLVGTETGRVDDLLALVERSAARLRPFVPSTGTPSEPGSALAGFEVPAEALRLYTEGLERQRASHPAEAIAMFERAVASAPEFALARAAWAEVASDLGLETVAQREASAALAHAPRLAPVDRRLLEGRVALVRRDWPAAIAAFRELELGRGDPLELGLRRARAESFAGQHDEARATLSRLARLAPPAGNDPRIALERGWAERRAGDSRAMDVAGRTAAERGAALDSCTVEAEGLALVAWANLTLDDKRAGEAACVRGATLARDTGHTTLLVRHRAICGWYALDRDDLVRAEAEFRGAIDAAREVGEATERCGALNGLAGVLADSGRIPEARALVEEGATVARAAGAIESEVNALHLLARFTRLSGDLVNAERIAGEGLTLARRIQIASRIGNLAEELGLARRFRGDVEGARTALTEALDVTSDQGAARRARREAGLAALELDAGRPAVAIDWARRAAGRLADRPADDFDRLELDLLVARAESRLESASRAGTLLDTIEPRLKALGGNASSDQELARAELAARAGRREEAIRRLLATASRPQLAGLHLDRLRLELAAARLDPSEEGHRRAQQLAAEARTLGAGLLVEVDELGIATTSEAGIGGTRPTAASGRS